jgi:hypothetical protein
VTFNVTVTDGSLDRHFGHAGHHAGQRRAGRPRRHLHDRRRRHLLIDGPGAFSNDVDPDQGAVLFGGDLVTTTTHGHFEAYSTAGGFKYVPDADFNGVDYLRIPRSRTRTANWSNVAKATITVTLPSQRRSGRRQRPCRPDRESPKISGRLDRGSADLSNASDVDGDDAVGDRISGDLQPAASPMTSDNKSFKLDTTNAAYQTLKAGDTKDVTFVTYKVSDGTLDTADTTATLDRHARQRRADGRLASAARSRSTRTAPPAPPSRPRCRPPTSTPATPTPTRSSRAAPTSRSPTATSCR